MITVGWEWGDKEIRGTSRVLPAMFVEVTLSLKGESTRRAWIRTLIRVCPDVLLKHRRLGTVELAIGANVATGRRARTGRRGGR